MELEEAKNDYRTRKLKKQTRFRKCSNCKFISFTTHHAHCMVKERIVEFDIEVLVCRYYKKVSI